MKKIYLMVKFEIEGDGEDYSELDMVEDFSVYAINEGEVLSASDRDLKVKRLSIQEIEAV